MYSLFDTVLPVSVLPMEELRWIPTLLLFDAMLPVSVLLLEEKREIPRALFDAVLFVKALPLDW